MRTWAAHVAVAVVACSLPLSLRAQADDEQLCQRLSGTTPSKGVPYAVAVGEVVWEEHDLETCAYVHIRQEFPVLGGRKLMDAQAWVRDNGESGLRVCTIEWSPGACFEDHDRDGIFEWGNGFWAPRPTSLHLPYKIEWRPEVDENSTRSELLFTGSDPQSARFSLREYSRDMKVPRTVSEVSYPLSDGKSDAVFRDLHLSLKRLEDGRISVVLSGGKPDAAH